jgi:diguanylate cyclase (GGDEF)-like protein
MIKFIKNTWPDLKKDLFIDAVKYLVAIILGVIGIWLLKKITPVNNYFQTEVKLSYYYLLLAAFLIIVIASLITFLIQNKKYQKLKSDSLIDELTGLYNHKAVPIKMKAALDTAKKEKKALSIIMFDIDEFKKINTAYLLKGGDNVMKQLGAYLNEDARAKDIICRQHLKGDEFILIAVGTNKDQARMAAERKRKEIEENDFQVNKSVLVKITVSCGVAEYDQTVDTIDSLIDNANKALLIAKGMGKNKTIVYEKE